MATSDYSDFSFGIELEYIIEPHPGSWHLGGRWGQLVSLARVLQYAGLNAQAYDAREDGDIDYKLWNIVQDHSIQLEEDTPSVSSPDDDEDHFTFELVSPVFKADSGSWERRVQKALGALRWVGVLKNSSTTGLHVHVGLRHGRWDLDDVKKIAMFCYRFEGALDTCYPPSRSDPTNRYLRSFTQTRHLIPSTAFSVIEGVKNIEELAACMNHSQDWWDLENLRTPAEGNYKVSFVSLLPGDVKQTIEFRQSPGTDDMGEIRRAVAVALETVRYCMSASFDDIKSGGWEYKDLPEGIRQWISPLDPVMGAASASSGNPREYGLFDMEM